MADPTWASLSAAEVVERLEVAGGVPELLALWRVREPGLAVLVAPALARSGQPALADLVVEEALHPTLGEPVTTACLDALRVVRPQLPPERTASLVAALRTGDFPPEPPQGFQGLLELLALSQDGHEADLACRMVVARETPHSALEDVRAAAFERSLLDGDLAEAVVETVYRQFQLDPVSQWADAIALLEAFAAGNASEIAVTLVNALLRASSTAVLSSGEYFPPGAVIAVHAVGLATVAGLIEGGELPVSPGMLAIVSVVDTAPAKRDRRRLLTALARHQAALFEAALPVLVATWAPDDWYWHLNALTGPSAPPIPGSPLLLTSAPAEPRVLSLALRLALEQPDDPSGELLHQGAARLIELTEQAGEPDPCLRFWWPGRSLVTSAQRLRSWIESKLDLESMVELVIDAYVSDALAADDVTFYLPQGSSSDALRWIEPGAYLVDLVRALLIERPDEAAAAVSALQGEEFAVEVAAVSAIYSADAAFAGAEKAWMTLDDTSRDVLMASLEQHANINHVDGILATVLAHTHASNTGRRAAAALRIADLLPPGADLPDGVVDLLGSGRRVLREAGASAIGTVRPRSADVVHRLSSAAVQAEGADEPAVRARSQLEVDFLGQLAHDPDTDDRVQLLELLGALGTAGVIDPLLDHLGEEAVDDDLSVRRSAAKALSAVAAIAEFSPEQQLRLVFLTEGESREVDEEAREYLNDAVARVTLGENAALQILFGLIGFSPKSDPEILFGIHLPKLIRHLRLYSVEAERGRAGWGLQIVRLDQIAEQLLRAAYLVAGDSDAIKAEIRTTSTRPDYGGLIQACAGSSELRRTQPSLGVLHELRSNHSEVPHPSDEPTSENVTAAHDCFQRAAAALVGLLDNAAMSLD